MGLYERLLLSADLWTTVLQTHLTMVSGDAVNLSAKAVWHVHLTNCTSVHTATCDSYRIKLLLRYLLVPLSACACHVVGHIIKLKILNM